MRQFKDIKRIVIKIGTNTLSKNNKIDILYVRDIAHQIRGLYKEGKQIVIVTSGAIGMGAGRLSLKKRVKKVNMRQACAAIGQPLLMHEYHMAFAAYSISIAQVLLTSELLNNRKSFNNLKNAVETLLHLGVIPILNENDSVSTAEIGTAFGDNDRLSALVASKLDADLLIMLSDINAFYDKDPRFHPDATPVTLVTKIDDTIMNYAGDSGSTHATGGMKTKLEAAKIVFYSGCRMVLACGRENNIITRIMDGEEIGTLFLPKKRLKSRLRWILNSEPQGIITIDEGAIRALRDNKSLLPSGITGVSGIFKAGSVVMLNNVAKAVTGLSSKELTLLIGKHSKEIRRILGPDRKDVVASPEDIAFLVD
ncbi:MAG: glutamate 5-kinase [Spirochaetales bacterium]|nr:glutamate 5-kinase [Spirochaetales bacterium]